MGRFIRIAQGLLFVGLTSCAREDNIPPAFWFDSCQEQNISRGYLTAKSNWIFNKPLVKYCFVDPFTDEQKVAIIDGEQEWDRVIGIDLVEDCYQPDINIFFSDRGVSYFLIATTKTDLARQIFLKDRLVDGICPGGTNCLKMSSVHEFGHALGFTHEHNRDDTPEWCSSNVSRQGTVGNFKVTSFDPYSVMNYCSVRYRGAGELSCKDIRGAQMIYGMEIE